jgi:hypothetical protein
MYRYGSALLLSRWLLCRVKSEPELCLLLVLEGRGGGARRGRQGDEYRRTGVEADVPRCRYGCTDSWESWYMRLSSKE